MHKVVLNNKVSLKGLGLSQKKKKKTQNDANTILKRGTQNFVQLLSLKLITEVKSLILAAVISKCIAQSVCIIANHR